MPGANLPPDDFRERPRPSTASRTPLGCGMRHRSDEVASVPLATTQHHYGLSSAVIPRTTGILRGITWIRLATPEWLTQRPTITRPWRERRAGRPSQPVQCIAIVVRVNARL